MRLVRSPIRVLTAAIVIVAFPLVGAAIATAETPAEVVAGTGDNGVFVATGLGDEADYEAVVERAAAQGLDLAVVEPLAPEPDEAAFALRVLQASDHDVVALVGQDGRIWLQAAEIANRDLVSARKAGEAAPTVVASLDAIVTDLVTEPDPETPEIVGQLRRAVFALVALIVLGTIADQLVRRLMASQRRRGQATG